MGVFTVGRQVALEIDMPGWWLANASVDMDFRRGLYYDSSTANPCAATNFLSCSRASIGYAKNADGTLTQFGNDALRIGVGTGLLVENARTNDMEYSQDFTPSGGWSSVALLSITGGFTAPDGTTTAQKVIPDTANASHDFQKFITISAVNYTVSMFAKAAEYNYANLELAINGGTGGRYSINVNLTTGAIVDTNTTGSPVVVSTGTELYGNGWVRLWIVITATAGALYAQISPCPTATPTYSSSIPIYTGDGTSGCYFWGVQFEAGSFVSSYIPTTTAAATRAADNITTSGSLQTVINAATASLVAQTDNGSVSSVAANIVDSNGTNLLGFDASNHALASITATLATGNTANRTTQDKFGLAWSGAGRSLVLNNGTVVTDATAQTPSATQHIGSSGSGNFAYAYVERLTAWTTKLADATLQALTAP